MSETEIQADAALQPGLFGLVLLDAQLIEKLFGLAGDGRPLLRTGSRPVQTKGALGDGAQLRSVGEIVVETLRGGSLGGLVVEVGFEPVRSVAPHGVASPAVGDGPKQLDPPGRGPLGEVEHAGGSGSVESLVDDFEVGGE